MFRAVDESITALQMFAALQWMWTWFEPDRLYTPEQVGASFVEVFLGGLLADRAAPAELADPNGPLPKIVRRCIQQAQQSAPA